MTGPAPAVAAVREAVRRELVDLPGGAGVVVACSGGADSLALAAAAAFVAPRLGLEARAVVVDHGLVDGSRAVAEEAARVCRSLELPADVVRVQVDPAGRGVEAAAREARYEALDVASRDAAAVLLGHTRDDQAEQVLLALARGSGTRSLAGIPPRRGPFRRPLLEMPRAVTEEVCSVLGLRPWQDPANSDPAHARSRVRTSVMPLLEAELGPGVAAALARSAALARQDADALDLLAAGVLADAEGPDGLDVEVLASAPDALRTRAVRRWLVRSGAPAGSVSREHVLRCDALVTGWHGQGPVHLPGRVVVERRCGRLTLARSGTDGPAA